MQQRDRAREVQAAVIIRKESRSATPIGRHIYHVLLPRLEKVLMEQLAPMTQASTSMAFLPARTLLDAASNAISALRDCLPPVFQHEELARSIAEIEHATTAWDSLSGTIAAHRWVFDLFAFRDALGASDDELSALAEFHDLILELQASAGKIASEYKAYYPGLPPINNPYRTPKRKPSPKQVDAPIMTDVVNDVLVSVPGRSVQIPDDLKGLASYISRQINTLIDELKSVSLNVVGVSELELAPFREADALLQNWSVANVLAFGIHLDQLEYCAKRINERTDRHGGRLDAILRAARGFLVSFPQWDSYLDTSVRFAAKHEGIGPDILKIAQDAASRLAAHPEHVDGRIPDKLREIIEIAERNENTRTYPAAITSEVRSLRNIAASYVKSMYRAGYENLAPQTFAFLRTACNFLPFLLRLASLTPDLASWISPLAEGMRLFCEGLSKTKEPKAKQ